MSIIGKVRGRSSYSGFAAATRDLAGIDRRSAAVLAVLVVAAEAATVLALLTAFVRTGFGLAAALLCCFSAALVRTLRTGSAASCHCFGSTRSPVRPHHVVRNGALLAIALVGFAFHPGMGVATRYDAGGLVLIGLVVVTCVLVISRLDDLVMLFRTRPYRR